MQMVKWFMDCKPGFTIRQASQMVAEGTVDTKHGRSVQIVQWLSDCEHNNPRSIHTGGTR